MRKKFFMLLALYPAAVFGQDMPPKCWEPYLYVRDYGQWSLNNGIWSLPFTCASGINGSVNIAEQNVMNLGYAEYYIRPAGTENGSAFFFTEPCGAMGKYCQYVVLPNENIPTLYSLGDQESPKRLLP